MRIEFTASETLRRALEEIGRTEDLKLSPCNRRLAIAGLFENRILLIDIDIDASPAGKTVRLGDFVEVTSPCLNHPHGVDFIDHDTIVVANRRGKVAIFRVPPTGSGLHRFVVPAVRTVEGGLYQRLVCPGSVSVRPLNRERYEILVCNNYVNRVTRHVVDTRSRFRVKRNRVLLADSLAIPDGVCTSPDGRWIAVSNHQSHQVTVFENRRDLGRRTKPAATLDGVGFPHGVRFTPDGRHILVSDSGGPFLYVYAALDTGWRGRMDPIGAVRLMDPETFVQDPDWPMDGGVKGIDIDTDMAVLLTTCQRQRLAVFDLDAVLGSAHGGALPSAA